MNFRIKIPLYDKKSSALSGSKNSEDTRFNLNAFNTIDLEGKDSANKQNKEYTFGYNIEYRVTFQ